MPRVAAVSCRPALGGFRTRRFAAACSPKRQSDGPGLASSRCALIWDATTTTAGTATAVTRGARAGEPADEDAGPAAVGDGRAHASTKVLRRGAESRRSALAAWADRPRDPVPDRLRRPSPGQTPVARRARTAKALQPGSPTAAQTRAADPRFAHQGVRAPPQALAATSRGQPRRSVARTWTGDASEHEGRRRARHRRERRLG